VRRLALLVAVVQGCGSPIAHQLGAEFTPHPLSRQAVRGGRQAHRWAPTAGGVIPLWVDSLPDAPGWSPELVTLAYEAARAWDTPQVPVRLVRAATPEAALVRVHWQRSVSWRGGGVTRRTVDARGETSGADCWIVLAPQGAAMAPTTAALRAVILHELGHALGLAHDGSLLAVMHDGARIGAPMQDVTPRDRAALRALYANGAGGATLVARTGP
jgi:hypothetical protein